MGFKDILVLALTHPDDLRTLIQYWAYYEPMRDITSPRDYATSGWNRKSMRRCWELLDKTSRSFAAVIKELEGDLARVICLFYIVLRALDTVEDDMTLPNDVKMPLLRSFHQKILSPGWNFTDSKEKDAVVLVEFPNVTEELLSLEPEWREVIVDICEKMQMGMADYAHRAVVLGEISLPTIEDYDLYCHYVAGLVGEGLSRLFSATGKEAPWLAEQLELSNSMGLLLQKTNIIRDFREDADDRRYFWPREIWADPVYGHGVPAKDIHQLHAPGEEERAAWVQSAMILDALRHATDALDYLRLLRNQSVFRFCAIPAVMALATLDVCFMNPAMFHRNVKIRKAQAARLIMRATNPRDVAYLFRDYARSIHSKSSPKDPSFLKISVMTAKIEQWAEHHYPSFVEIMHSRASGSASARYNPDDPRSVLARALEAQEAARVAEERAVARGEAPLPLEPREGSWAEVALFIGGALALVFGVAGVVVYGVLYLYPN
ncbi:isoprenoid synthase domain-containing protein [Vararia minispora EC-137]|uniref:Isoprenoid synthase domain-containing protein n=1 Tax=Vararia minispora EC-137 TaxID=1314806 RepID=A0ACB8QMM6_9AGAM|nr:isoprenoid synthase domain-containing protein [Vararia minispora EC-137]